MKRRLIIFLWSLVLIAGVCIMLYPTVSSLVNARNASQTIVEYEEIVAELSEEEIAAIIQAATIYNIRLAASPVVMTEPFDQETVRVATEGYADVLNLDGEGLMGYIDIPLIGVHLPIYHGTTTEVLARSVGHLEGTSVPVGGNTTHTVLSAHRGLTEARLFTDLDQLEVGDTFSITVLTEVLTYQIYDIEVVVPTDVSSLNIQEDRDLCTLVTCTPLGINTHRMLVHAERIETPDEEVEEATLVQSAVFSWWYFIAGGVVALIALIILVKLVRKSRRRRRRIRELWKEVTGR